VLFSELFLVVISSLVLWLWLRAHSVSSYGRISYKALQWASWRGLFGVAVGSWLAAFLVRLEIDLLQKKGWEKNGLGYD